MKLKNACFVLAIVFCVSAAYPQVTGSGTKNTIPVWTGTTTIGNSVINQAAGKVGIGTKKPNAKLDVETTSTTQPAIIGSSGSTGVLGFGTGSNGTGVFASGTLDGVFAAATGTTGFTYGLKGASVANPNGAGVQGIGAGIGVIGTTQSCTTGSTCPTAGTAGLFATGIGGNVLVGDVAVDDSWTPVFRVDSTGKGFFDGGTQTGGADFAESVAVAKAARIL
jgi:hypothetical protein